MKGKSIAWLGLNAGFLVLLAGCALEAAGSGQGGAVADEADGGAEDKVSGTLLRVVGNPPRRTLNLCEGDCDGDGNCARGLVCFQRREGQPVPACSGTPHEDDDYCVPAGGGGGGSGGSSPPSKGTRINAIGQLQVLNGGWEGIACNRAGDEPTIGGSRSWKLDTDRRLTDQSSRLQLYCQEGSEGAACTCRDRGEAFHGGQNSGTGPVHDNLLEGSGQPIYPDADSGYTDLCLRVRGGTLVQVANGGKKSNCSLFKLAGWRRL